MGGNGPGFTASGRFLSRITARILVGCGTVVPRADLFTHAGENLRLIYRTWRVCRDLEGDGVHSRTILATAFYDQLTDFFEKMHAGDDPDEHDTQVIDSLLPLTLPPTRESDR